MRDGLLGGARLRLACEEHAGGRQLVRLRLWPRASARALLSVGLPSLLAAGAALDGAWLAVAPPALLAGLLALRLGLDCAAACAAVLRALATLGDGEPPGSIQMG